MKKNATPSKQIAQNRKARFNYEIADTYNAGIVLLGSEIKSIRVIGGLSIIEAHASRKNGEMWIDNLYIPEYKFANKMNSHDPRRSRKLLMRRKEIAKLSGSIEKKGMTAIPLSMYFNSRGLVKLEIALGKGKKLHDKRETIKRRDWDRNKARILKGNDW